LAEKSAIVDLCHLIMFPVYPDNVNVVEFVPKQTVVDPATAPPIEFGNTDTFTPVLLLLSHPLTVCEA
jgi:hypothetical protein